MKKSLTDFIKNQGLTSHTRWTKAHQTVMEGQEKKDPTKYREYISKESRELIEEKRKAETDEDQERYKMYKKLVGKSGGQRQNQLDK